MWITISMLLYGDTQKRGKNISCLTPEITPLIHNKRQTKQNIFLLLSVKSTFIEHKNVYSVHPTLFVTFLPWILVAKCNLCMFFCVLNFFFFSEP